MIILVELDDDLLEQVMELAVATDTQPPTLLEQLLGNGLAIQRIAFIAERDGKGKEFKQCLEKLLSLNPAGANIIVRDL